MNFLTFSQFIFALGTILLIRKIIKNRDILNGFDLVGSFLTMLAMTFVLIFFVEVKDWLGLCAGAMQWLFWFFVVLFVSIKKFKKKKRVYDSPNSQQRMHEMSERGDV